MVKEHMLGVRLDAVEKARLDRLAEKMGIGRQDVVRLLIKAAADKEAPRLSSPSKTV
jgi:antitoxin component of RelBE/YafQ-DinJ toxin-antitoxin module